jgi:hypothetical protein
VGPLPPPLPLALALAVAGGGLISPEVADLREPALRGLHRATSISGGGIIAKRRRISVNRELQAINIGTGISERR